MSTHIGVFTSVRHTRRQVARALYSGAIRPHFFESADELEVGLRGKLDLVVVDCDEPDVPRLERVLTLVNGAPALPVVLLSTGGNKQPLLELARDNDICNVIAKHGAIRAVFPMMDERELLVTCEKVLKRNIFGIEKYVGSWGVVCHTYVLKALREKDGIIEAFGEFVTALDCPNSTVSAMLTVADELIMNAVIHGPHGPDGAPKYEAVGPTPDMVLEENEQVTISFGCDGQRLMLSVSDNFGRLTKETLYGYLVRSFGNKQEVEMRPSGAGLGLSMAFRNLHQLIINVQERVQTEAIAGWYLRTASGAEFRQVAKSFNLFWLDEGAVASSNRLPRVETVHSSTPSSTFRLVGHIDEASDFSAATRTNELDLREVKYVTSRGVLSWLAFLQTRRGSGLRVRGLPEPMVRLASSIDGMLEGVIVASVMVPIECSSCHAEQDIEVSLGESLVRQQRDCTKCGGTQSSAVLFEHYEAVVRKLGAA